MVDRGEEDAAGTLFGSMALVADGGKHGGRMAVGARNRAFFPFDGAYLFAAGRGGSRSSRFRFRKKTGPHKTSAI